MIDHISIVVKDFVRSRDFYDKALAPLGYTRLMEFPNTAGYGANGMPAFWIGAGPPSFWREGHAPSHAPIHVALSAKSEDEVRAFHAAALAAGGTDFGAPGQRAKYHPGYYGAFVLDPDGNNVEAVIHHHKP